ncbi:Hypothetical predicted protein [Mytilus galloprovincialis]|uniref:Uncharacterized protein n=1 Tax=Mytilus galloprovincialis TaxID=29158 RepID=A0A8B6DXC0_MYTGA|nr:Hypothetical predicted protein [Mytilus galloprovincialis]
MHHELQKATDALRKACGVNILQLQHILREMKHQDEEECISDDASDTSIIEILEGENVNKTIVMSQAVLVDKGGQPHVPHDSPVPSPSTDAYSSQERESLSPAPRSSTPSCLYRGLSRSSSRSSIRKKGGNGQGQIGRTIGIDLEVRAALRVVGHVIVDPYLVLCRLDQSLERDLDEKDR